MRSRAGAQGAVTQVFEVLEELLRRTRGVAAGGRSPRRLGDVTVQPQQGQHFLQELVVGARFVGREGTARLGAATVALGHAATDGHLELHFQGGEEKYRRSVHIGRDMLPIAVERGVEVGREGAPRAPADGPMKGSEEPDLAAVMFGIDELVEMTEVVNGESEGMLVRAGFRAIGQERHAPVSFSLQREDRGRGGHVGEKLDGEAVCPRQKRARNGGGHAMDPSFGHETDQRGRRRRGQRGDASTLMKQTPR